MESLSPFLQGSFIPYHMPVYPGARRVVAKPYLGITSRVPVIRAQFHKSPLDLVQERQLTFLRC